VPARVRLYGRCDVRVSRECEICCDTAVVAVKRGKPVCVGQLQAVPGMVRYRRAMRANRSGPLAAPSSLPEMTYSGHADSALRPQQYRYRRTP
jgi:hypothetical protein